MRDVSDFYICKSTTFAMSGQVLPRIYLQQSIPHLSTHKTNWMDQYFRINKCFKTDWWIFEKVHFTADKQRLQNRFAKESLFWLFFQSTDMVRWNTWEDIYCIQFHNNLLNYLLSLRSFEMKIVRWCFFYERNFQRRSTLWGNLGALSKKYGII